MGGAHIDMRSRIGRHRQTLILDFPLIKDGTRLNLLEPHTVDERSSQGHQPASITTSTVDTTTSNEHYFKPEFFEDKKKMRIVSLWYSRAR